MLNILLFASWVVLLIGLHSIEGGSLGADTQLFEYKKSGFTGETKGTGEPVVAIQYSKLKVLVADDFSNFRSTVGGMLNKLGVQYVDSAATAQDVLHQCSGRRYDLILCDYDLGYGQNGQQVLEELRHRAIIDRRSIFIIVSADATKDVVMAAYDCEPDDYLMKPITAKMLEQRVSRLLSQRQVLGSAYAAVDSGNVSRAIALLVDLSISPGRHCLSAQKLLGEMFLLNGELNKAEKLYTKALESRQLDWARLGLARVKQLKGELDVAGEWLEAIVQDSPLFLPAYDTLAENWSQLGDSQAQQMTVQRSVEISPKSILRQKRLASVAEENDDLPTALGALRQVVRLGEHSCHASEHDNLNFARVASKTVEQQRSPAEPLLAEALELIAEARERYTLSRETGARADLLEGQALYLAEQKAKGQELASNAERILDHLENLSLDVNLERLAVLQTFSDKDGADQLVEKLLQHYAHDEKALEKLDRMLNEPVSQSSQDLIASVNREGIDLYNRSEFDEAIARFEEVLNQFPRHVGVHLNMVQSLIGKIKSGGGEIRVVRQIESSLGVIESLVGPGDAQFARFNRLRSMAAKTISNDMGSTLQEGNIND